MTSAPGRPATNRYLDALLRHFRERPESVFCRQVGDDGESVISWRDLEAACGRFGAAYRAAGLVPGDQALIFLRHVPDLYGAFFGAMLTGVVPAFMPCSSPRQDLGLYWQSHQTLMDKIRPGAVVTDAATAAEMAAAGLTLGGSRLLLTGDLPQAPLSPRIAGEDAIALLQHSSGTTGLKKGVALDFTSILAQMASYGRAIALTADDVIVSWLPLYHDMGLIACLILPAFAGVPVTHIDPFHWLGQPGVLFDRIASDRGTLTWLPNFAFEHLAGVAGRRASRWDLSAMRAFINCSEPCKPATFDRFAATFAAAGVRADQLQCCYAMAETVFAASQTEMGVAPARLRADPSSLEPGARVRQVAAPAGMELIACGGAIAGAEISVWGPDGTQLPPDTVGEIRIAGDFLFSGYNGDPALTAQRLNGGLYTSRDLGFLHAGSIYVLGRMDDVIIVNGRNLFAHEVEALVSQVQGVKPGRACAVAWFDPRVGSQTLVIMAERNRNAPRADEAVVREVMTFVHSVFNVTPRTVELIDEGRLIKTSSGKISRVENLRRYEQGQRAALSIA